jgi:hypothetical protein
MLAVIAAIVFLRLLRAGEQAVLLGGGWIRVEKKGL